MRNPSSPPVTSCAAAHAERIRGREQARTAEQGTAPSGQSTAERYAQRILPGYRADEELREKARLRELEARGIITPESDVEDVDEDAEEFEEVVDEDVEEEDQPVSTAERYARIERKRQAHEHELHRAAMRGISVQAERQARRIF